MGNKVVIDYDALSRSLGATADAIREKTGWEGGYPFEPGTGFKSAIESIETNGGYEKGYEDGLKDGNIINPNWTNFSYLCQQRPDLVKKMKYSDTANGTTFQNMCYGYDGSLIPNADFVVPSLDTRKGKNFQAMFQYSSSIKEIGLMDISNATNVIGMHSACSSLERVTFVKGCIKLSMSFSNSSKLDDVSIQSIVDGYADMTGQTSPSLTVHKTVGEKLTEEQKAALTAKNVILAY